MSFRSGIHLRISRAEAYDRIRAMPAQTDTDILTHLKIGNGMGLAVLERMGRIKIEGGSGRQSNKSTALEIRSLHLRSDDCPFGDNPPGGLRAAISCRGCKDPI